MYGKKTKKVDLPTKITPELAYFCGVLAGDGSIGYRENKKEYWIKCVGNPKDEKEFYDILIKNLIKKLFNINVISQHHDKGTTYGIRLYSKHLVKYLTEFIGLPLGKKYNKLHIPHIFLYNKELTRKFISGLADTDFCLHIKKRCMYPIISGVSKSQSFIKEIKKYLKKDGYNVYMYERNQFDERVNKFIKTHYINIYGRKYLRKWIKEIGFRQKKNIQKIEFLKANNKLYK